MTRAALAVLAAAALASCGDTLVDHRADLRQGPGSNLCDAGQVSCHVDGADVCKEESATFCGEACADCAVGFGGPQGSVPACLGTPGLGICGYECTGGLLKCTAGGVDSCCQATALSAGEGHTCAVTASGGLHCWGEDAAGQVSGTIGSPALTPRKRYDAGVVAVAAGEAHTCAALADEVRCWGRNVEGQAPPSVALSGVIALAAGLSHTCAIVDAGSGSGPVSCWGTGPGAGGGNPVVTANAIAIAAGADHTCAVLSAGNEVVCWGGNAAGQLGNGTTTPSLTPVRAIPPGTNGAEAITSRGNHTCAALLNEINGQSTVLCWGDQPGTAFGLAAAQTTPAAPLDGSQPVIDRDLSRVATGRTHVCVQRTGAEGVECFGAENASGQLGGVPIGSPTASVDVSGPIVATAFAAGGDHTCAILGGVETGQLRCWGSNASGQLGDGTTVTPGVAPDARPLGTPVPVSGR